VWALRKQREKNLVREKGFFINKSAKKLSAPEKGGEEKRILGHGFPCERKRVYGKEEPHTLAFKDTRNYRRACNERNETDKKRSGENIAKLCRHRSKEKKRHNPKEGTALKPYERRLKEGNSGTSRGGKNGAAGLKEREGREPEREQRANRLRGHLRNAKRKRRASTKRSARVSVLYGESSLHKTWL